jgi:hypothetical protein
MNVHHHHCDCPALEQQLNWDELSPQHRNVIINSVVPECFPVESRIYLSLRPWADIHTNTQTALRRVDWAKLISGGVQ